MKALAALLLAATPAAAAEPQQFNLMCSGMVTPAVDSRDPRIMDKPPQRWSRMFRIDLAARTWCEDDCARIEKFGSDEEHPGKLVFRDDVSLLDRTTRERHTALYDPRTRQYEGADTVQDLTWGFYKSSSETRARCEAGPFAGFPAP